MPCRVLGCQIWMSASTWRQQWFYASLGCRMKARWDGTLLFQDMGENFSIAEPFVPRTHHTREVWTRQQAMMFVPAKKQCPLAFSILLAGEEMEGEVQLVLLVSEHCWRTRLAASLVAAAVPSAGGDISAPLSLRGGCRHEPCILILCIRDRICAFVPGVCLC